MSGTASGIGIQYKDKTIMAIECCYDSDLEHLGMRLFFHYVNEFIVEKLISKGDVRRLGKTLAINPKRESLTELIPASISDDQYTEFAGVSWGETSPVSFRNIEEFQNYYGSGDANIFYLWKDGEWFYKYGDTLWLRLHDALISHGIDLELERRLQLNTTNQKLIRRTIQCESQAEVDLMINKIRERFKKASVIPQYENNLLIVESVIE